MRLNFPEYLNSLFASHKLTQSNSVAVIQSRTAPSTAPSISSDAALSNVSDRPGCQAPFGPALEASSGPGSYATAFRGTAFSEGFAKRLGVLKPWEAESVTGRLPFP